eukprot:TRINITY_DN21366_c0_g1_i1.p1 TRINITY_DN21366_c0_g1~~TRINITY_DN21366_c0_g1_i1.p1  ORF type:complete len:170 (-),score=16.66 TRINITY_DN21366_c0_g1_i1:220-729(-)
MFCIIMSDFFSSFSGCVKKRNAIFFFVFIILFPLLLSFFFYPDRFLALIFFFFPSLFLFLLHVPLLAPPTPFFCHAVAKSILRIFYYKKKLKDCAFSRNARMTATREKKRGGEEGVEEGEGGKEGSEKTAKKDKKEKQGGEKKKEDGGYAKRVKGFELLPHIQIVKQEK